MRRLALFALAGLVVTAANAAPVDAADGDPPADAAPADAAPAHLVLRVSGMDCAGCNATVAAALDALPFLRGTHASFAAQGACATLTGPVDEAALRAAVATTPYAYVAHEVAAACPPDLRGPLPAPWDGRGDGLDVATISHGEAVDLAAHLAPGKYTIVDFGASWCGPCHEAADVLAAYLRAHPDVAVRAVELGGGDPSASYAQPVVAQHLAYASGIPWLVAYAPDGKVLGRGQSPAKILAAVDKHRAKRGSK